MEVRTRLGRDLSEGEREALSHYGADSTYLHAAAQGRSSDFQHDPAADAFWPHCATTVAFLDSAILASSLEDGATLRSGHGNGFAIRGSFEGDPAGFVGLTYRYPGFISTSSDQNFCERFLNKRRSANSRPVLMTFNLRPGFHAIDMKHGGHFGEFEFLLGRNLSFAIVAATNVDGDILSVTLEPV